MRQIDVHVKTRDKDAVIRVVKAFKPVDWMIFPVEQHDRALVRIIMHDGRSQSLSDGLQDALRDSRDWRITMIPIEATLPVPEPLEDEEAKANLP